VKEKITLLKVQNNNCWFGIKFDLKSVASFDGQKNPPYFEKKLIKMGGL